MKKIILCMVLLLTLAPMPGFSQGKSQPVFTPAKSSEKQYNALYILNSADDKKIHGILRNITNALNDPRLKGKLHVELIAFGNGVAVYKKANNYESILWPLKEKGVVFAQCSNTMKERKISKKELYDFVHYVPSGNGEIILRQYEGWAIVHP